MQWAAPSCAIRRGMRPGYCCLYVALLAPWCEPDIDSTDAKMIVEVKSCS